MMRVEDKPWVETDLEGRLNLGSWAAAAAYGLVELAVETLEEARVPLTKTAVRALAESFAVVIARVQRSLGARVSLQDSLHTRLRGALRCCLKTLPPPFGGTLAQWDGWANGLERRLVSISTTAEDLWATERPVNGRPWLTLAAPAKTGPARATARSSGLSVPTA
jgi:hypothetical protein